MAKMLGIDLGTSYTRICVKGSGIVLRSPSVIALENSSNAVLAAGMEAKHMIGRTPPSISAIKPIVGGTVTNIHNAALLVGALMDEVGLAATFRRPTVLAATPFGATESEKRALEDALFEAGASTVMLTDAPTAAALGAGMRIMSARGGMIVDIGAGTIEVAVLSHGGIIISSVLKTAGDAMTAAVIRNIIENHSVHIGEMSAETAKVKLGTLDITAHETLSVSGKSTKMGGAAKATVTSAELREALLPYAETVIKTIRSALEAVPPELSSDIASYGILLCGGGSLLPGLAEYIKDKLGMNVARAKAPQDCVCRGLMTIMEGGSQTKSFIRSVSK